MITVYKLAHNLYDTDVSGEIIDFKSSGERGYNLRRHKFDIIKEKYTKDIRKYAFKPRITNQWNNLPKFVVEAPTLNAFKNRLNNIWKRDGIMFDFDADLYERATSRRLKWQ